MAQTRLREIGGSAIVAFAVLARAPQPAAGDGVPASPPATIRYDRDVRPLLSDRCFQCHGPDAKKRRAKLRLDDPESAFADRGDYAAIVPGDPDASEVLFRVASEDDKTRMPPPESNKPALRPEEQALIRRWIEQGAIYEPHWSFVPPVRPPVPDVRDGSWPRNDLDRFILARLEAEGVAPSPDADPETLIRRLFLDLTGLPPEPEESDAFLADLAAGAGAFERWVDRLLTEEPYRSRHAEHMATPWLDAARYADTCGIHTDAGRQMWLWRDWVLAAFRENMPFDRFVTEQLAGDLLPDATEQQRIASGFNRNHVTTDEGGAISEEYLVEYAVDRTATTGSVFLGLTLGCARCHEHKFDPVSQEEFYGLYSFFNSIEEPGLYSQLPDPNRAFEPAIAVATPEQAEAIANAQAELAAARAELDAGSPEEDAQYEQFLAGLPAAAGLQWHPTALISATARDGATLAPQADGSVLASGANPAKDEHTLVLRSDGSRINALVIEALPDPSLPHGRVGRAPNGNAVLSGVVVEAAPLADPAQLAPVMLQWAWADVEQPNGDYRVVNVLDTSDSLGWAVDAHNRPGGRVALLLAETPFGFEGGTELRVRLQYDSIYAQHAFGRVRVTTGFLDPAAHDRLPAATSGWYHAGPFDVPDRGIVFDTAFGPESDATIDLAARFGAGEPGVAWNFNAVYVDGKVNDLPGGVNAHYVARRCFAPTARKVEVSLGSDDGFRIFVNGVETVAKAVDRGAAPDQDRVAIELAAGVNVIVLKIANTGGQAGFYWRAIARENELEGALAAALLPETARHEGLSAGLRDAWKTAFSPGWKLLTATIAALEARVKEIEAQTPRTMVMKELPAPRATYVLMRGEYDKADPSKPVTRGVPAALGRLPEGAPPDRRGLAQWLTAPDHPLVARVAVNRWWEQFFGTGIVATTEDFGHQGEWPSHPELLDWLAREFSESGFDVRHVLRTIVTSRTYRQSSRVRPEVAERDPENRWLSWFPRGRMTAEQIRDQALHVSGLLVERLGGPSVKPYQPDGLWREVAMPASNTREFRRDEGEALWRRSLYTYWKRASPPPSLLTFDAPTREFCTIRRLSTNTPLQALVLWNDVQFVEAARSLAERTLAGPGDDDARLATMFRRCAGVRPDAGTLELLREKLAQFRARYVSDPEAAAALLAVGERKPDPLLAPAELAAWTLIANALLSLDAVVCKS